jgi:hypothetical protein
VVSFINVVGWHQPLQWDPTEPPPGDRVADLPTQRLIPQPVAELEEHHPQIGLHRRRRPTDPRIEERRERLEEALIVQQGINPSQLLREPQQIRRQDRLEQRQLIAYRTKHDGLDPF